MRYRSRKFPNKSIISLITQENASKEKMLFIYMKAVPDYYENEEIGWFDKAGKNGKSNKVWACLNIRQWVAFGKDEKILELFNLILNTKQLTIGNKTIDFEIPQYTKNENCTDKDQYISSTRFDSLKIKDRSFIPQEFYQKENLQYLLGYKTGSSKIKPIFPLGFYEDDFIYNNLKNDIWGIKETRTAYLRFHGVKESSVKGIGSTAVEGFYQQNFDENGTYFVMMKNENGQDIAQGCCLVDTNTGFFHMDLKEPVKNGRIEVLLNNKKEKDIEFSLIQEIKLDINIVSKSFIDTYGRSFNISSENMSGKNSEKRPDSINNFTYQQDIYSDTTDANKKLSDLFKSIFDYLGPKILIVDPYFLGIFKEIALYDDQIALLNAMIHSTLEYGMDNLSILGYWGRAGNLSEKKDDGIKHSIDLLIYERKIRQLIERNNLQCHFSNNSVRFFNANKDFHSRYWFSITNKNGIEVMEKCVIVTNSIGNIKEVDFVLVTDESQLKQIIQKYTDLWKNAEEKLNIKWNN
ncbi:MAG: hypothetical protein LBP67_01990 [Bacteroidales bacterium]|jgi:hypothetical protein|nr:hypothetical protein [Bacteroidales bacterium]